METRGVLSIITELPFDFCDRCDMQEYGIKVADLYANGDIYARSISLHCDREMKCRQFYNMMKKYEGAIADEID